MINIDELIKNSIKNKDSVSLKVYRNLKSDILVFKTQKNAPEYNEFAEISIIKKYYSKMEDAEKQYFQAGREDLVKSCREELEVLKKLLPKPVEVSEINSFLSSWCWKNGYFITDSSEKIIPQIPKKNMGTVIKIIKEQFPGADGKMISDIVKNYVI